MARDIDRLLRETEKLIGKRRRPSFKLKVPSWVYVVVIVLVVFSALFMLRPFGRAVVTACKTRACFLDRANDCLPAEFQVSVSTAKIDIVTSDRCTFRKRIVSLRDSEPAAVRELFEGAEMECSYVRGNFDAAYLDKISGNLVPCSGTLVDALNAVV